jgi:hypothetical protein
MLTSRRTYNIKVENCNVFWTNWDQSGLFSADLSHRCRKLPVNRKSMRSKCTCIPQNCIFICWSTKAIPTAKSHLATRSFTNLLDLLRSKLTFIRQNSIFICQSPKANTAKFVSSPSQVSRPNSICWDQSGLVSADWLILLTSGRTYNIKVENCNVFWTNWDQSGLVSVKIVFLYANLQKRIQSNLSLAIITFANPLDLWRSKWTCSNRLINCADFKGGLITSRFTIAVFRVWLWILLLCDPPSLPMGKTLKRFKNDQNMPGEWQVGQSFTPLDFISHATVRRTHGTKNAFYV